VKLLVTGGAGYLGTEVARQAVAAGHDVVVTWLRAGPAFGRPVNVDLADTAAVDTAFEDAAPAVVIHTAYRQADKRLQRDVVDATANVVRAAVAVGARLVHVSTDLVFGDDGAAPYREDAEPRPVSRYGRAKLEAERIVARDHGDAVIVRTSLLYGNAGGPQEELALRDDIAFFVDEIRTPTHVADLAAALLELAEGDERGILHVAGAESASRYELARLLAADQGRDPDELRQTKTRQGSGRPANVALDTTRAQALLRTRMRGVREVLGRGR
jgi:dTDP-4-dehydrorhamnose reductase